MGISYKRLLEEWVEFVDDTPIYYTFVIDEIQTQDFFDNTVETFIAKQNYSEKTQEMIYTDMQFKDEFFKSLDRDGSYTLTHAQNN